MIVVNYPRAYLTVYSKDRPGYGSRDRWTTGSAVKITRRQAITLAGTAAAAVVAGNAPSATAAVAYTVTVSGTQGSGTPSVHIVGSVPVARVAVTAYAADGAVLSTLTDLAVFFGTTTDGWWRSSQRMPVQAPGVYDILVEITAESGEIYREFFPRGFIVLLTTRLANLAFTPSQIDADHRSITFSGDLLATDPATGTEHGYAGQEVAIDLWYANGIYLTPPPSVTVTTDAQGHFATVFELGGAASVNVNYYGRPMESVQSGASASLPAGPLRPARLTVAPDQPRTPYGGTVNLVGRLEWQLAGEWVPCAGKRISLGWGEEGSAVTDADGRYSITILAQAKPYTVFFNSDFDRDYLVASAEATTEELRLIYPVSIPDFTAYHAGQGVWHVYGNVIYQSRSRGTTTVHLQTTAPGTQNWTTIASVQTNGVAFQADITVPSAKLLRAQVDADDTFLEAISDDAYLIGPQVKRFPPKVSMRLRT